MSEMIVVGGFEKFLHKLYKEQGPEAVEAALALLDAIEEKGDEDEEG